MPYNANKIHGYSLFDTFWISLYNYYYLDKRNRKLSYYLKGNFRWPLKKTKTKVQY